MAVLKFGVTTAVVLAGFLVTVSMSQPADQAVDVPKSRAKRDLFSLSGVIRCVTGNSALLMCCVAHDRCYALPTWFNALFVIYPYRCIGNTVVCMTSELGHTVSGSLYRPPARLMTDSGRHVLYRKSCVRSSRNWLRRSVCECDKALAECFARSVYNRRFKNYPYCGAQQPEDPAVGTGKRPAVDAGKKPTVNPGKDEKPWVGSGDGYDRFIN
ncbi:Phospholipase A2, major isoenzyme [Branchiostoma belcheri]|nr:Phospholipase A2, major isoenzyme [Branchiostoma belcheri]